MAKYKIATTDSKTSSNPCYFRVFLVCILAVTPGNHSNIRLELYIYIYICFFLATSVNTSKCTWYYVNRILISKISELQSTVCA